MMQTESTIATVYTVLYISIVHVDISVYYFVLSFHMYCNSCEANNNIDR